MVIVLRRSRPRGSIRHAGSAAVGTALVLASVQATAQHGDDTHVHPAPPGQASAPLHEPAAHAAHGTYVPPPLTDADRAAAFPDVGPMDMGAMMIEDPFNRLVLLDRLEAQEGDRTSWDFRGWVGRNAGRLWIRTEGERESGAADRAELQLLYGKPIAPWWDVVAGVREDFEPDPSRTWAAAGVQGLLPYRFEFEATAFVAEGGRSAARVEAQYELLITNRLVLQPLVELNWYGRGDPARGIGAGLATAETGLRLRYEIRREVAPYIGVTRDRSFGRTADLARAAGRDSRETRWVAGVRLFF